MQGVLPEGEIPLFIAALEKLQAHPRKSLRINPLGQLERGKKTLQKIKDQGIELEERVPWCELGYFFKTASLDRAANHPLLLSGAFFIQEAGAMEVVEYLDVQPGQEVLDLCAAPGAKSTQIGEHLKGQGTLTSNDPHRERARTLSFLLSRHGISNSNVYSLDPHLLSPKFLEKFDRILIDAPCSGESLFAKRKEKRFDVSDREVKMCAQRQHAILNEAAKMAKVGARLVYSTCTYSRAENESVVESFLSVHPEFQCLSHHRRWPHRDGVAGGYFAVLIKNAVTQALLEPHVASPILTANSTHGLIRLGLRRWDGSEDFYTIAMDRAMDRVRDVPPSCEFAGFVGQISFQKDEIEKARKFLSGDVSVLGEVLATGLYRVLWDEEVIGLAEKSEKSWIHRTPLR